jgi:hypothetical protein
MCLDRTSRILILSGLSPLCANGRRSKGGLDLEFKDEARRRTRPIQSRERLFAERAVETSIFVGKGMGSTGFLRLGDESYLNSNRESSHREPP